ncbi:MAG: hypothetical protein JNM17_26030 [Archangium sp.]|nr:hypothetical protein [Archangium sp.]
MFVLGLLLGRCGPRDERSRGFDHMPVVVANADIAEGALVEAHQLGQRSIPERFSNLRMVKPDAALEVVGRRARVALAAGQPIFFSDFEPRDAVIFVAARDLDAGVVLIATDVVPRTMPSESVPDTWLSAGWVPLGWRVVRPLHAGQPLMRDAVTFAE